MPQDVYEKIPPDLRELIDIQNIEPEDFDYSTDELWVELKKESTRLYKKLKEREFQIRHAI